MDNPGRLTKVGEKYFSWFKKEYPKENIVETKHKHEKEVSYWYEYTEKQIEACLQLCKILMSNYNIQDILGHDDIAPFRKNDPGPLFPLENFRAKLFGREDTTTDMYEVIADNVNIRRGPSTDYDIITQLKKETKVEFMKSNMGWFNVYVLNKPTNSEDVLYGWVNVTLLKKVIS